MDQLDVSTQTTEAAKPPETPIEKTLFDEGLELYEKKAPYDEVIPVFERATAKYPKDSTGPTCLSWLYLLRDGPDDREKGFQYARNAVKQDPKNGQAHFNLILAMLMTLRTGVRSEVEKARQKCSTEEYQQVIENLKEALERKPDLSEAAKLLSWLES